MYESLTLEPGCTYHIYNRANDGTLLFREHLNYQYFLQKYQEYIRPIAHTYAYCLIPNHFHFVIQLKATPEIEIYYQQYRKGHYLQYTIEEANSLQFSNFFNAYSKAYNKIYKRHGNLLNSSFKRKLVDSEPYFINLIQYVHTNPVRHFLVKNSLDWQYSSYSDYINGELSFIQQEMVWEYWNNTADFEAYHQYIPDFKTDFLEI